MRRLDGTRKYNYPTAMEFAAWVAGILVILIATYIQVM